MNGGQRSPSGVTGGGRAPAVNQGAAEMGTSGQVRSGTTYHIMGPSVIYVFGEPGSYSVNSNLRGDMGRTFSPNNNPANYSSRSGNEVSRNQAARMPVPRESSSSRGQSASASASTSLPSTSGEETSRYFQS